MSSPSLEYAAKPPMHRRRSMWKGVGIFFLLGILASGRWWFPPAWRHVQLLYWQHQCMIYTTPPDQQIFASDRSVQVVPAEWAQFYSLFSPPGFYSQGTIFVHEMKTPDGQKRLVAVDCLQWFIGGTVELSRVFKPGTPFQRPEEFAHRDSQMQSVAGISKIYAGQIDLSDPCHFTFQIEAGDKKEIYDGWLQNDDRVVVGPRRSK